MNYFSTKGETLGRLKGVLKSAEILPQVLFAARAWPGDSAAILARLRAEGWLDKPLIVRSSAAAEDGAQGSLAGRFKSVPDVSGEEAVRDAVALVARSYGEAGAADQIFIQPMLIGVACGGVALSHDPNSGGPYFVINYDDTTGSTLSVTSGWSNSIKTFYGCRSAPRPPAGRLGEVAALLLELEELLQTPALDVEFAFARDGRLYLLQVRPLTIPTPVAAPAVHRAALEAIRRELESSGGPRPGLRGERAVFGVMPDWNPAEAIGMRPRPLALSLYQELITDEVWALSRRDYGYSDLKGFPLMMSLAGLPYIDVRVDFNSFIPKNLGGGLGRKLVNYYMERLIATPGNHDKVEFEIVFSCYTLDLPERLRVLSSAGFSPSECAKLSDSLRNLTNRVIHPETGLWRAELEKIERLAGMQGDRRLDGVSRIASLLDECKRFGTLPFAGLARAAFIAVEQLRSLVAAGVLSAAEREAFMASLKTVSSTMRKDFQALSKREFLKRYGHLRPGTYDVLSPRYDEEPQRYFDWTARDGAAAPAAANFAPSTEHLRRTDGLLREHKLDCDARGFFDFIRKAIEGREHAKFVFTRSLSDALSLFKRLWLDAGLSAEDCSFGDIRCLAELGSPDAEAGDILSRSAASGRARHALTRQIVLPPLIVSPEDVWGFHWPAATPNFITLKGASGAVAFADGDPARLSAGILFIPSADPGYEWIFSRGIAGLVTMYGGVNSHMAIRAGELGIPAVIGAGEVLYKHWASARRVELDCANRQVRVL